MIIGFSSKGIAIFFILLVVFDQVTYCKRGASYGRSSRGSSHSRNNGRSGIGSRYLSSHNHGSSGRGRLTDRLFGRSGGGRAKGLLGGSGNSRSHGGGGGLLGGLFGRGSGSHKPNYGAKHAGRGGLLGGLGSRAFGRSRGTGGGMFRNGGVGSRSRGSTFKNMIVGAAAGFLAYKAGKAIIRNVAAPMMWNNRPYYWGAQHYRPPPQSYGRPAPQMCRMPIDPSDPVLGQVYMSEGRQERPKEIVWSCDYNEECCGYECCPRGY